MQYVQRGEVEFSCCDDLLLFYPTASSEMRLEAVSDAFPPEYIQKLQSLQVPVRTVDAFLMRDEETLCDVLDVSRSELFELRRKAVMGAALVDQRRDVEANTDWLAEVGIESLYDKITLDLDQTGVIEVTPALDCLLGSGLRTGIVTELVGGCSTGKSQFCMLSALSVAGCEANIASSSTDEYRSIIPAMSVLYMDSSNDASRQRMVQMYKARHQDLLSPSTVDRVMNAVHLVQVEDVYSILRQLSILREQIYSHAGPLSRCKMIILDGVGGALASLTGGDDRSRAMMEALGRELCRVARDLYIAVLVTNGMVVNESRPALGLVWESAAQFRVLLTRDMETGARSATLLKHSNKMTGEAVPFVISERGID